MVAGLEWYLHTMGYYSAIERNKVLIHATVWMHLENTMPTKRHVSYDLTYMRYLEEANSQRQKVEQRFPRPGQSGNGGTDLMGMESLLGRMKKFGG